MGMAEDMRKLFTSGGLQQGDSEEIKAANKAKIAEVDKSAMDKIVAVLTPEQQSKWKEMTGEPFTGKLDLAQGGGRRSTSQVRNNAGLEGTAARIRLIKTSPGRDRECHIFAGSGNAG